MKNHTDAHLRPRKHAFRTSPAFTLIELLVVISIIAILAALLLPVLGRARIAAQKKKAQIEVGNIAHAIHSYESDYSKFPVSSLGALNAMSEASKNSEDFTYGTFGVTCAGPAGPAGPVSGGFSIPGGGAFPIAVPGLGYQANNSEVMAVLLDAESWPASGPTINQGHVKNPHKTQFLNATRAGNMTSPGIGPDGVYRDPWGNPYIITIDLNYDDKARDAFYRSLIVSADPLDGNNPKRGLNGLIPKVIGAGPVYEAGSPVMVWSAGPDKMIDPNAPATAGANRDNILSWK